MGMFSMLPVPIHPDSRLLFASSHNSAISARPLVAEPGQAGESWASLQMQTPGPSDMMVEDGDHPGRSGAREGHGMGEFADAGAQRTGRRTASTRRGAHGGVAMRLEVQVLGRCVPRVDGAEVILSTRKAQALVAVLALDGPRSREELADLLWGELGEDGARQNLRKTLHRLRGTPLGERLDTRGPLLALRSRPRGRPRTVAAGDRGRP